MPVIPMGRGRIHYLLYLSEFEKAYAKMGGWVGPLFGKKNNIGYIAAMQCTTSCVNIWVHIPYNTSD